jgi:hypothetical protein
MATAALRLRVARNAAQLLEIESSPDDRPLNQPVVRSYERVGPDGLMIRDADLAPGTYQAQPIVYRYGVTHVRVYSTGSPELQCLSPLTTPERSAAQIVSLLPFTLTGLTASLWDGEQQIVDLGVQQCEQVETLTFSGSESQRVRYWHRIIGAEVVHETMFRDAAGASIEAPALLDSGIVLAKRECYGALVVRYTTEYRLFRVFYDCPELGVEWTVTAPTTDYEHAQEIGQLYQDRATLTADEYELRYRDIEARHAAPIRSQPRAIAPLQPLIILARLGDEVRTLSVTKDILEPQYPLGVGQQVAGSVTVPCYIKDVINEAQGLYLADIYAYGLVGAPSEVNAIVQVIDRGRRPALSSWTFTTRVP